MRTIDMHAHLTPQCFQKAIKDTGEWHGMRGDRGELNNPRNVWTPEQRLGDMNSLGVDMQVISTNVAFYRYDADATTATTIARLCNDEVNQMTMDHPDRFAGFATIPMQDVGAAIAELERSMTKLGLKGAMIDDKVNGRTFDDPEFLPFWKAAEEMGALIFVHQSGPTLVAGRADRYHLPNSIGNLVDRAVTFATLVFGGVMDKHPDLKICLAHGGGYTCFGIGRMDRGWEVRPEAREHIQQPPSAYLDKFYYDCLTHSETALRFLIDAVGVDRILFGTDWPADMAIDWPVSWVMSLASLSIEEKEAILWKNLEKLLNV